MRTMTRTILLPALLAASLLGGCAGMMRQAPVAGDSMETVIGKYGQPTGRYQQAGVQVFEYATGPMGQQTYMARFGADGRLSSFEQVLGGAGFARIKVDRATKPDVLALIGRPAETSRIAMKNYEVWSYRYKENDVWDSLMHVHFDEAGVVRMLQNGPDPMYDKGLRHD